ncbi:hypothetical protein GGF32_010134 [Allomyces javanicus]|nr:hypothetical protein GGF32_010134 [Allomyces javanicus]
MLKEFVIAVAREKWHACETLAKVVQKGRDFKAYKLDCLGTCMNLPRPVDDDDALKMFLVGLDKQFGTVIGGQPAFSIDAICKLLEEYQGRLKLVDVSLLAEPKARVQLVAVELVEHAQVIVVKSPCGPRRLKVTNASHFVKGHCGYSSNKNHYMSDCNIRQSDQQVGLIYKVLKYDETLRCLAGRASAMVMSLMVRCTTAPLPKGTSFAKQDGLCAHLAAISTTYKHWQTDYHGLIAVGSVRCAFVNMLIDTGAALSYIDANASLKLPVRNAAARPQLDLSNTSFMVHAHILPNLAHPVILGMGVLAKYYTNIDVMSMVVLLKIIDKEAIVTSAFETFLAGLSINSTIISSYVHIGNSMVKLLMKLLRNSIVSYLSEKQAEWDQHVKLIAFALHVGVGTQWFQR